MLHSGLIIIIFMAVAGTFQETELHPEFKFDSEGFNHAGTQNTQQQTGEHNDGSFNTSEDCLKSQLPWIISTCITATILAIVLVVMVIFFWRYTKKIRDLKYYIERGQFQRIGFATQLPKQLYKYKPRETSTNFIATSSCLEDDQPYHSDNFL